MGILDSVLDMGSKFLSSTGGGGLIQGGLSMLGGLMSNSSAMDRQQDAQQYSAQQYATRYQTQVKDLQAAGLNPMLAYSQGPGSSPQGQAAPVRDVVSPAVQAYQAARMNSAQTANIEADTANKQASADLIAAQAANQWASARQSDATVGQIEATVAKIREETQNIPVERERLKRTVELIKEQIHQSVLEQLTESQRYNQLRALISKIQSETSLLDLDIKAATDLDNIGRSSKELAPIVQTILSIIRTSRSK